MRRAAKVGEGERKKARSAATHSFTSYKMPVDPAAQAFSGGVRNLAAETLPLLRVHHLKNTPQLLQKVKSSQAAHERRGGRLAIKHAVGVVQSLGAWGTQKIYHYKQYSQ